MVAIGILAVIMLGVISGISIITLASCFKKGRK